jgi:hypothetical protein
MKTGSVPFVFSTPVWGAGHLGLFVNVSLPSLLAPGNLLSLAENSQNFYLIYTRPEDEENLRTAPAFRALAAIVPVEVILIREEITEPHRTMSDCHVDSLRRADELGAAAVFLPPDCVWSDGSMTRLEALARSGKSVVHMSGIRLDRDGVVPELAGHFSQGNAVLSMKARDLVAIGLRHLHPIALTHFWNEYDGGLMPANLVWTVPGQGLLLRCFHLHPLMVKSQVPFAKFESTIDDDLALRACPDASRDYVVTDSDELLAFEMSGLSRVVGTVCPKGSIEGVAAWAEVGTNKRHRELIRNSIRLHVVPVSKPAWAAAEAESDKVVDAVTKINALSWPDVASRHPAVFQSRLFAVSLGRTDYSGPLTPWIRLLVWLRVTLLKLNAAVWGLIFLKDGVPMITHPYWIVRRGMISALDQCFAGGERHVVLIGADPQLAQQLQRLRPGLVVQAFPSSAIPDAALVQRAGVGEVDLLVAIDVDRSGTPAPQHIGKRQILLRLAGDTRPADASYKNIRYFGRFGTRLCSALWLKMGRLRARLRPTSVSLGISFKAVGLFLMPLIYGGMALMSLTANVVGLVLDRLTGVDTFLRADKATRPHGPPA